MLATAGFYTLLKGRIRDDYCATGAFGPRARCTTQSRAGVASDTAQGHLVVPGKNLDPVLLRQLAVAVKVALVPCGARNLRLQRDRGVSVFKTRIPVWPSAPQHCCML